MYETSTEAVYLVYIIISWDKIPNRCSEKLLTNKNACSIIAFSEMQKAHPNHTSGVGAPLKWTGLLTYTQIQ